MKLRCEFLSRYSNKIESVGLRKMSVLSLSCEENDVIITNVSQSLPHIMAENSRHRYGMKKLRYSHPMYSTGTLIFWLHYVTLAVTV